MSYHVVILSLARREIDKLPRDVKLRIAARIVSLEEDPRPNGAIKMQGAESYRIRIGDYRVVYTIDDEVRIVAIIRAGHRRDVYR